MMWWGRGGKKKRINADKMDHSVHSRADTTYTIMFYFMSFVIPLAAPPDSRGGGGHTRKRWLRSPLYVITGVGLQ